MMHSYFIPVVYNDTPFLSAALHAAERVLWAVNFTVSMPAALRVNLIHLDIVSEPIALCGGT